MKWVLIRSTHINMDRVEIFRWEDGRLYVRMTGLQAPIIWKDPDKKLYFKMCRSQGVRVYDQDRDGEDA